MPLYDYLCPKCHDRHEVFVPLRLLEEKIPCPKDGEPMERQVCTPAIHYHG